MITLVMTYTLSLPLWALQIPFNVCIAMAGLLCPPCPRKSSSPQRPLTCLTHCHSRPSLLLGRRAHCGLGLRAWAGLCPGRAGSHRPAQARPGPVWAWLAPGPASPEPGPEATNCMEKMRLHNGLHNDSSKKIQGIVLKPFRNCHCVGHCVAPFFVYNLQPRGFAPRRSRSPVGSTKRALQREPRRRQTPLWQRLSSKGPL